MRRLLLLTLMLLAPALAQAYNATAPVQIQPNATLSAFISANVPSGALGGATYYLTSLGGRPYILITNRTGGHILVTQGAGGAYSFSLNASNAFSVLKPYELSTNFPGTAVTSQLGSAMAGFENASDKSLNACLSTTGIAAYNGTYFLCNASTSNTSQKTCMFNTCERVPICGGILKYPLESILEGQGIPSPFSRGVQNLSLQYHYLHNDYSGYFGTLSSMNASNAGASIKGLIALAANVSATNATLGRDPVFSPPPNYSQSYLYAACGKLTIATEPWYCQEWNTPYCARPNFNVSDLGYVRSTLAGLASLPLTDAQIAPIANATVSEDEALYRPILLGADLSALLAAKASLASRYSAVLGNATALLVGVRDPALSANVTGLEAAFYDFSQFNSSINATQLSSQQAGLLQSINVSFESGAVTRQLGLVSTTYAKVKAQYGALYSAAANNTVALLLDQLEFGSAMSEQLASLLVAQQSLNVRLSSGINASQMGQLSSNMSKIKSQSASLAQPFSMPLLLKAVDGGLLNALESGSGSIAAKETGAPLWVFMISLVVGAAVLLIVFVLTYVRLRSKKRIRINSRVNRAWAVLFLSISAVVLLYSVWTYTIAVAATGSLPVSSFINGVVQSRTVYIGVNTSVSGFSGGSPAMQCANALRGELNQSGKAAYLIRVQNYSCSFGTGPGFPVTGTACLNYVASRGPVILIDPESSGSLSYSGLYQDVLQAGGAAVAGPSCMLAGLMAKR